MKVYIGVKRAKGEEGPALPPAAGVASHRDRGLRLRD